jgi:hypothetical protein
MIIGLRKIPPPIFNKPATKPIHEPITKAHRTGILFTSPFSFGLNPTNLIIAKSSAIPNKI